MLDMRATGGIIADGCVSFKMENENTFMATFEATSIPTSEEVKYKIQRFLLVWDSLVIAFVLCLLAFAWGHAYQRITMQLLGMWGYLGVMWGMLIIVFLFYYLLFRHLQKYRYIYAVEQFKRYHADEQWIAIGEDVFPNSTDSNFDELKKQCIYNGFGLLMVDMQLNPVLLITPSRVDLFGKRRQILQFLSSDPSHKTNKNFWQRAMIKLFPFTKHSSLQRYRRTYLKQMILCMISSALMATLFYKELQNTDFDYVDEELYPIEMQKYRKETKQEPSDYQIDSPYVAAYRKERSPYVPSGKDMNSEGVKEDKTSQKAKKPLPDGAVFVSGNEDVVIYDCARFYFEGTKFMLYESRFESFEAALQRVSKLADTGLEVSCLWMGCFSEKDQSYVVFFDLLYDNRLEARQKVLEYQQALERFSIQSDGISVKSLKMESGE